MDMLRALGAFNRIVEAGSFSAVARETNSGHAVVGRLVDQLEAHFGLRPVHRTTRHLSLTEDGKNLLGHARRLLEAAEDMEGALGSSRGSSTGTVRVGLSAAASTMLVPRMGTLFDRYPGLSIELVVHDTFADLFEERLDVALQAGQPSDTSFVARVVGTFGRIPVATPEYLERYGVPANPTDLASRPCIIHDTGSDSSVWRFNGPDGLIEVAVSGVFRANNGGVAHRAALAGYGIAFLWEQHVADDIRAARLYPLLADYPSERSEVYVIYPSRRYLAPRTRVVIDFLVEQVRLAGAQMEAEVPAKARAVLSEAGRRIAVIAPIAGRPPLQIVRDRQSVRLRYDQSPVKGFLRELLGDAEPLVARIMSMKARRLAGTCRCPG